MREPFLTQFRALVSAGAAGQAIHHGAISLSLETALPVPPVAPGLAAVLNALLPWQKFLFRTPVA